MLAAAQQTCRLSPNDAECFYILGHAQYRLGQVEEAARNFEQALDRNPMPPAYLPAFYATALGEVGAWTRRYEPPTSAWPRRRRSGVAARDRISALVGLGRRQEARDEATRLLAQFPRMTAEQFGSTFAATATALRQRRTSAARQAGFPATRACGLAR